MSEVAIRAEGLAKSYRLGGGERVFALTELSFEVAKGEVVGVLGRNGAGKSTLLKILARITEPSAGWAALHGRVGSMLEVGTGFHPELTGRENVYLNGALSGLTRKEIARRFDAIASFAEVERFLDTPVKHYSSGMAVRLAFAVAAHLVADILLVDEVLAVGDVAFQRKSLGKMNQAAKDGRTVLFVSHDVAAVSALCSSVMLLEGGRLSFRGAVGEGVRRYLALQGSGGGEAATAAAIARLPANDSVRLVGFRLEQEGSDGRFSATARALEVHLEYEVLAPRHGLCAGFSLYHQASNHLVFRGIDESVVPEVEPGRYRAVGVIPAGLLGQGEYRFAPALGIYGIGWLVEDQVNRVVELVHLDRPDPGLAALTGGCVQPRIDWRTERSA
jgi:lipopolysaccharide transport system ATP-binding protein